MTNGPLPHRRDQHRAGSQRGGTTRAAARHQAGTPDTIPTIPIPPARSALGLRRVLALFGLLFCGVTAGVFAATGWPLPSALLALLALVAAVDLVVIQRRIRRTPDTDR